MDSQDYTIVKKEAWNDRARFDANNFAILQLGRNYKNFNRSSKEIAESFSFKENRESLTKGLDILNEKWEDSVSLAENYEDEIPNSVKEAYITAKNALTKILEAIN
ncbi:MAG: hypothetical protein PVJ67_00970 [Candidatus Pacearchaeota archaeon]|jgi:hypothetical protein